MNRRDFLLFRTEHQTRIVELSCERLYMRYLDSQATTGPVDEPVSRDSWDGEPPAQLEARTTRQLFDDLDRELQSVDIVRVVDTDWLAREEFRREVELLISAVRARGGRVEYQSHRRV
jgi:hypothetical protein